MQPIHNKTRNNNNTANIFQAAIIDEQGNEIPITEQMIQDACRALEEDALAIYSQETTGQTYPRP